MMKNQLISHSRPTINMNIGLCVYTVHSEQVKGHDPDPEPQPLCSVLSQREAKQKEDVEESCRSVKEH